MAVSRDNVSGSYSQDDLPPIKPNFLPTNRVWLDKTLRAQIGLAIGKAIRRASLAAITTVSIGLSGCCFFGGDSYGTVDNFMDKQVSCMRDHVWAKRAFHLRYGHCERVHADHFRDGFIAGYSDVCDGGSGDCPAMPPERYWGFQYQNQEGAAMQNAWFAGFESGAGAGQNDGSGTFREVQISREVEQMLLVDESIKNEHAGIRKEIYVDNPVFYGNPADPQKTFEFESGSQMITPMANTPMAIPEDSWKPASTKINPQQPLPMQIVPNDLLNDVPVIVGPSQR